MGKENEIIRPQSRLDANTVAKSRAIDAQRGAVNAERQGMQTERALQRKYRRAVRNEDFGGAADIAKTLALTGGSTVGPVIRKAEEERMVAGQRAIDRAELQLKIRDGGAKTPLPGDPRPIEGEQDNPPPKVDQGGADDIEGKTANPRSKPGAGKGRPAKGGGNRTVGDRNEEADGIEQQAAPPPAQGSKVASGEKNKPTQQLDDSFESFANDLKRSKLIASGDSGAIERAVARGEDLGATREQTLYEIENNKGTSIPTLASLPPDEKPSLSQEVSKALEGIKKTGNILDSVKFSEPSPFGPKGTDKQTPDPDFSKSRNTSKAKSKNPAAFQEPEIESTAYWNINPSEVTSMKKMEGEGVNAYLTADTSDPRFPVMKIIQDAEAKIKDAYLGRDAKRRVYNALGQMGFVAKDEFYSDENARVEKQRMVDHEVIWRAAKEGVDLTDYARTRGPVFFNDYQEAKNVQARIKSDEFLAAELQAQVSDLIAK
jgi:hypothetical protein